MNKIVARTLSFTFAPALIALVGISSSTLGAIEPQDVPAKPKEASVTGSTTGSGGCSDKAHGSKHHKHHHHHHKGEAGRKQH